MADEDRYKEFDQNLTSDEAGVEWSDNGIFKTPKWRFGNVTGVILSPWIERNGAKLDTD